MSKKKKKKKKGSVDPPIQAQPKRKAPEPTPVQDKAASPSFWVNQRLHMVLIFFVGFGLYSNTLGHLYAVDDSIVILRNRYTKKGLKGMSGIWTEDTFTGFFGSKRKLVAGGRYRPFSVATFALEMQLFGTPVLDAQQQPVLDEDGDVIYNGNPFISHLINVLLYGLLCVVLYLVLLQCFNPKRDPEGLKGYFLALVGALLYAAHPVHTEAVANIKGRDEILVLLGSLLTLYWVLRAAAQPSKSLRLLVLAGVAYAMAIFSKENAVTFLAIIPGALYIFTDKSLKDIALLTSPYLVIFLAFFAVRSSILGESGALAGAGATQSTELMNDPFLKYQGNTYVPFTAEERYATILYTWSKYIGLLVFPKTLTNDYYPKHIRTDQDRIPTFQMPMVLGSFLLHLALGVLMILGVLRRRIWGFLILFYLATFSVVSNLIFPIGTNMAERFMFLPSVGFSALCALGLYEWAKRAKKPQDSWAKAFQAPTALALVVFVLYSGKTISRNTAWKNDYTLFTTDIEHSPHSAKLNNAVSGVMQDEVKRLPDVFQRLSMLEQARQHSITAVGLHPTYHSAWLLLGNANVMLCENALQRLDQTTGNDRNVLVQQAMAYNDQGLAAYDEVVRWKPDHKSIQQNFGVAYRTRGKLLGQYMGDLNKSIAALERAIGYLPEDSEARRLIGVAYGILGSRLQESNQAEAGMAYHIKARESFEKAVEINPQDVGALYNLQMAWTQLGNAAKAQEMEQRWKAIDPNYKPQ